MPLQPLRHLLKQSLCGARSIAILAVGSELRADDAVGLHISARLKKLCPPSKFGKRLKIFIGETAPENLTGEIIKYNPGHLVIIDAADTGKKPGAITIIPPQDIGGISFSTHQLPLKLMITYLHESIASLVTVIGIQPRTMEFAAPMSKEVKSAVEEVAQALKAEIEVVLKKPSLSFPRKRESTT